MRGRYGCPMCSEQVWVSWEVWLGTASLLVGLTDEQFSAAAAVGSSGAIPSKLCEAESTQAWLLRQVLSALCILMPETRFNIVC